MIILTLIFWFWIHDRMHSIQLACLILLVVTHTIMAFQHIKQWFNFSFIMIMAFPIGMCLIIYGLMITIQMLLLLCCKKRRIAVRGRYSIGRQPNNQQPSEINQSSNEISNIQRTQINLSIDNILTKWKKQYTLSQRDKVECWWVWIEEFAIGDDIIELKCNSSHIFHSKWLEGWADWNTHWPLWRKDLIQMERESIEYSFDQQNYR